MIKRESERIIKTIPGHRDRRGRKIVIFSRFVRDVIVDAALRNQNESVSLWETDAAAIHSCIRCKWKFRFNSIAVLENFILKNWIKIIFKCIKIKLIFFEFLPEIVKNYIRIFLNFSWILGIF